jgi:N-acetylmuramoyl-L-alanine amidase
MIYSNDKKNLEPAECIYKHVFNATPGTTKRAIQTRTDLAELKSTKATSVYVECEFHDNLAIAKWIIENTQVIGEAIAKGICEYYGVNTHNANNLQTDNLYKVQVGAYKNKANAEKLLNKIKDLGIVDAYITK